MGAGTTDDTSARARAVDDRSVPFSFRMERNVEKEKKISVWVAVMVVVLSCVCIFKYVPALYSIFYSKRNYGGILYLMPSRVFRSMFVGVLHIDKPLKCPIMSCLKSYLLELELETFILNYFVSKKK